MKRVLRNYNHISNNEAEIHIKNLHKIFTYNTEPVLDLTVNSFDVFLKNSPHIANKINSDFDQQISMFYKYTSTELFKMAIDGFINAENSDVPFNAYVAILEYNVKYNENCHLSNYRDEYYYTGGAHGTTTRLSDTFNLNNGLIVPLSSYFKRVTNYRKLILDEIIRQAEVVMETQPIYFDNYKELIIKNFNEKSYYLTSEGIVVYFQQYEIAPYSTGIVEFVIPYEMTDFPPTCRNVKN